MKSLSGKTYLEKPQQNNSKIFVCLLLLYIVIIYSNTLQTPFLLDDRVNIVERPNLHLSILTVKNVANTFFAGEANNRYLHRPLSSLSLALNYYVGRFNVAGYHVVNLSIHLIAAVFLYKILILLLGLKKFNFSNIEINCIAGLATILWAAHPIQTQAVTYMIQRMASLSAMFYVIGLWFYLKFRCPEKYANGKLSLFFSGLFFCCAILSKEIGRASCRERV